MGDLQATHLLTLVLIHPLSKFVRIWGCFMLSKPGNGHNYYSAAGFGLGLAVRFDDFSSLHALGGGVLGAKTVTTIATE